MHDAARGRSALVLSTLLLGLATAADVAAQAQAQPGARLQPNNLPLLVAPPQVRPDLSITGVDVETRDDGHHVTVRVGFKGSSGSQSFRVLVRIERAGAGIVAEQPTGWQTPFDPAPSQPASREIALLFPALPPGTYTAAALVSIRDGQEPEASNNTATTRFVVAGPPNLQALGLVPDSDGKPTALKLEIRNDGPGEATQVLVRVELDGQRLPEIEQGAVAVGASRTVTIPLTRELAAGSHAVAVTVVPIPADANPADNVLTASFDVTRAPWWPWVAAAVVAAAVGLGVRAKRARVKPPPVITVKGVPGQVSARIEPSRAAPPGFTLRWVADRGVARVSVPGPPRPEKTLTETAP